MLLSILTVMLISATPQDTVNPLEGRYTVVMVSRLTGAAMLIEKCSMPIYKGDRIFLYRNDSTLYDFESKNWYPKSINGVDFGALMKAINQIEERERRTTQ
jgi:predicted mannosyl-3-phosphoglycerate phosphatase (HAD superfamily)